MSCSVKRITLTVVAGLTAVAAPVAAQTPSVQQPALDSAARNGVIERLLTSLDEAYVFPEKATEMGKAIRQRLARGEYERLTSATEFADSLTSHLQAVSHDKHLRVRARGQQPGGRPAGGLPPSGREDNFGIGEPKLLAGNVGYLELRTFGFPPEAVGAPVALAMTAVADADALIIDVRRNGGGHPGMVALVSSYLFGPDSVHLNSLYFRPTNRTDHFWTRSHVSGKRFGATKPLYVLTSDRTFSAAEEFTYNLQSRKRATIVGDTTGGGAHPGGMRELGNDFLVFVPSGRAINPITKTNWEGTGVRPEIAVATEDALTAAHLAALQQLIAAEKDPRRKGELERARDGVRKPVTERR